MITTLTYEVREDDAGLVALRFAAGWNMASRKKLRSFVAAIVLPLVNDFGSDESSFDEPNGTWVEWNIFKDFHLTKTNHSTVL